MPRTVLAVSGLERNSSRSRLFQRPARMWFFTSTNALVAEVRRLAFKMSGPPYAFRVSLIGMESEMLIYSVTAGPPVDSDVASRRLTVTVNGEVASAVDHPASTTAFGEISVPQDASVVVSLIDVDDAGNESQPSFFEFSAKDTIPPSQPGSLGVTLVREE